MTFCCGLHLVHCASSSIIAVGDVRLTRSDYSPLWFIIANHRMTWDLLVSTLRRRSRL